MRIKVAPKVPAKVAPQVAPLPPPPPPGTAEQAQGGVVRNMAADLNRVAMPSMLALPGVGGLVGVLDAGPCGALGSSLLARLRCRALLPHPPV